MGNKLLLLHSFARRLALTENFEKLVHLNICTISIILQNCLLTSMHLQRIPKPVLIACYNVQVYVVGTIKTIRPPTQRNHRG